MLGHCVFDVNVGKTVNMAGPLCPGVREKLFECIV